MTGAQLNNAVWLKNFAQSRVFPWLLATVGVGALLLVDLPLCGMKTVIGVPCPGCGMTRALSAVLTGDLAAAFAFHPLVFVLLPLVGTVAFVHVVLRRPMRPTWTVSALFSFGLLSVALWVYRLAGGLGGHPDLSTPFLLIK